MGDYEFLLVTYRILPNIKSFSIMSRLLLFLRKIELDISFVSGSVCLLVQIRKTKKVRLLLTVICNKMSYNTIKCLQRKTYQEMISHYYTTQITSEVVC